MLQNQLTAAHEELSDARFRAEEMRATAASKEQQVGGLGGGLGSAMRAVRGFRA